MKKNIVFYYVDEWTILNENMKFKSNCLVLSNDFKTDFLNDIDENVHMIFLDKFKYFNFLKHRNSILPLVKFLHYIHSNEFSYKDFTVTLISLNKITFNLDDFIERLI